VFSNSLRLGLWAEPALDFGRARLYITAMSSEAASESDTGAPGVSLRLGARKKDAGHRAALARVKDWTRARFRDTQRDDDGQPIGQRVPQAVEGVAAFGLSYRSGQGWDAGLRLRYFGPRALTEDNRVRSRATTVVNLGLGYLLTPQLKITGEVLNLFDSRDHDIDYFYESRLAGESGPVADRHFHPVEPINGRVTLRYSL